ncbi:linker for activation of T-cells family member 2 isoform X1 [Pteronotus mesoamericanus]|uniref:linker for activation of T-cells family member 2 isoform X1 n=1 Tax=Pteronotus mesoamericanus TaxID=1884717 RepID=UPI0023EAA7BA|nr:linker for activation of T-cells family member 2 isoform X1 [Pteronotus parnellii mesoamericanus]
MSTETELLWPGAALLLLLGAVASLCVRCSRSGAKQSEKICEQRNLQESQQNFAVARTYSLARPLMDVDFDLAPARKDKLLQFSPSLDDSASPRYQNFRKGSRQGSDAAYIDPITMDYYLWGQFPKPQEADDDDANSYENVLICKQKQPDSDDEESEDYQNSASIQQWQESRRVVGKVPRGAPPLPAGSPDEDDEEPDYVNGDVAAVEARGRPERRSQGTQSS